MLPRFAVRNGATLRLTFGCYYSGHGHDPHYHDHIHWPAPDYHPGAICQMRPPRDRMRWTDGKIGYGPVHLDPIHLAEEGYSKASVTFDDQEVAQYFTDVNAEIDEETDHYVRLRLLAQLPLFEDKPRETRFTVYVTNKITRVKDAVCHGIISVLPANAGN